MFVFTPEEKDKIEKIVGKYPVKQSALLPLLTLVQRRDGYVSPEAMEAIGEELELSPAYVQSVMSFYTMYHAQPTGKYIILFCHNISCQLNGADELLKYTAKNWALKWVVQRRIKSLLCTEKNVLPLVAVDR